MRIAAAGLLFVLIACGDNAQAPADATRSIDASDGPAADILVQLQALPGVTVSELTPMLAPHGYRYFHLEVEQPVDHDVPAGPTFSQAVSLIHRDATAPMVLATSGYDDFIHDYAVEPTVALDANQISIEHRFFGTSRPDPEDWSKLTIRQMAADEHAIVQLLAPIYRAAWISTGGSKGGMTAIYHRRFYPGDVAGTVAYVAPESFAIPDPRYATFIATVGTPACRTAVRALATEMLQHRRAAFVSRALAQNLVYTRIAIGPAVESAIEDLEWSFWQYVGVSGCASLPAVNATDDVLFQFLDQVSPVGFSDDASSLEFEAYFVQAYSQLGSPGTVAIRGDAPPPQLEPYRMYSDADYTGSLPLGLAIPVFDPAPMQDIDHWVQTAGADLVFIYGQWDPWRGGAFQLGSATDSLEVIGAQGTHNTAITDLSDADRAATLAKLAAWTGVTPQLARVRDDQPGPRPRPRHPGPAGGAGATW